MSNLIECTRSLLDIARAEMAGCSMSKRTDLFYQQKIQQLWERATKSQAYSKLPPYSAQAFASLLPTERQQLKDNPLDFLAIPINKALKYYETTGTTGRPTPTPRVREDIIWNTTSVMDAWGVIIQPDDRVLILLPSDIVPVADLVVGVCENLGVLHTKAYPFTLGISDWDRIETVASNFKPTVIFIAPGVCQQFTRVLRQRGVFEVVSSSVQTIMLLGEVNTPAFRHRLGQWWGASVFDASYGSTETGTLAAACREGHQHLLCGANYFEIRNEQGLTPLVSTDELTGRLVVTPLNLFARPLLRFDTGDVVTVSTGCSCGADSPRVMVHGRTSDAILLHSYPVRVRSLEDVVYGASNATGYLVETAKDGSFGRLLLERNPEWDRSEEPKIIQDIQSRSLSTLATTWDEVRFVNTLPSNTKSGASQKSWKRSNIRVIEVAA